MAKSILNVPDTSCGHCVLTINKALRPIEGVRNVQVRIPTRQVEIEHDEDLVDLEQLAGSLAELDYPVGSVEEAPLPSQR